MAQGPEAVEGRLRPTVTLRLEKSMWYIVILSSAGRSKKRDWEAIPVLREVWDRSDYGSDEMKPGLREGRRQRLALRGCGGGVVERKDHPRRKRGKERRQKGRSGWSSGPRARAKGA